MALDRKRPTDHAEECRGWVCWREGRLMRAGFSPELARQLAVENRIDLHETLDDLALQCANDALSAVLGKLGDYRFESRFTTWAYKFAILQAAVQARRRAWQDRELPTDPEAWTTFPARALDPLEDVAQRER